jgi:hypothetical protein
MGDTWDLWVSDDDESRSVAVDAEYILECFQHVELAYVGDGWPTERWPNSWCLHPTRDQAPPHRGPGVLAQLKNSFTDRQPEPPSPVTGDDVVALILRCAYAADLVWAHETALFFLNPDALGHGDSERAAWCVLHDALLYIRDHAAAREFIGGGGSFAETYAEKPRVTKKWLRATGVDPARLFDALSDEMMRRLVDDTLKYG